MKIQNVDIGRKCRRWKCYALDNMCVWAFFSMFWSEESGPEFVKLFLNNILYYNISREKFEPEPGFEPRISG